MKYWKALVYGLLTPWLIYGAHQGVDALMKAHNWKGLSPADWASWIQAFGSIAAIAGTYLLARSQHEKERQADLNRRRQEVDDIRNGELQVRTLAVRNAVQVVNYSLEAAGTLIALCKHDAPDWETAPHIAKLDQQRTILDSLITSSTEHLVVIAALEISYVLAQTQSDMQSLGGTAASQLIARSELRMLKAQVFLHRLNGLQKKLDDTCRVRGIPLEIDDYWPQT